MMSQRGGDRRKFPAANEQAQGRIRPRKQNEKCVGCERLIGARQHARTNITRGARRTDSNRIETRGGHGGTVGSPLLFMPRTFRIRCENRWATRPTFFHGTNVSRKSVGRNARSMDACGREAIPSFTSVHPVLNRSCLLEPDAGYNLSSELRLQLCKESSPLFEPSYLCFSNQKERHLTHTPSVQTLPPPKLNS